MNQPRGRAGFQINSIDLLKESKPVIATGEWDDIQCKYFKGTHPDGMKINDIILVHEGKNPVALCKIKSDNFTNDNLKARYHNENFRYVDVFDFYDGNYKFPATQGAVGRLINNTESRRFIHDYYLKMLKIKYMNNIIDLLSYKKQIILQGPPGTGKTRMAKKIAQEIITKQIDAEYIIKNIKVGQRIKSPSESKTYTVSKLDGGNNKIELTRESGSTSKVSFSDIINAFNKKSWQNTIQSPHPRLAASLAKYLYDSVLNESEQFSLVQFHPSFTYEDFIRGIVVNGNGDSIEYKNVNKTLGEFAHKASTNLNNSKKATREISIELQLNDCFDKFKDYVFDEIEKKDGILMLTNKVGLISTDDNDAFRYTGISDGWSKNGNRMLYDDILKAYLDGNGKRQDLKNNTNLSKSARQHSSYYLKVLELFNQYLIDSDLKINPKSKADPINKKNFVLVIDEINRANLSAVLGELIYALEYRGEPVQSMYDVDNSNELLLPKNLYIIGTMNTADRSVGHIDYAIRRRFAFVDLPPKDLSGDSSIEFDSQLFQDVQELFTTDNYKTKSELISDEFEPKHVALGHSYFIDNTAEGGSMDIRLEYEIKPILREYVKDGILKDSASDKIEDLKSNLNASS